MAGDDPQEMQALVEEHIRRQGYHLVRDEPDAETRRRHAKLARVMRRDGYRAVRTAMDLPASRRAVAAARAAASSAAGFTGKGEFRSRLQ